MLAEKNYTVRLTSIKTMLNQLNAVDHRDDGDVRLVVSAGTLFITRLWKKKELVTIEIPVNGFLPFPLQIKWRRLKQLLVGHSETVQIVLNMSSNGRGILRIDNMLFAFEPLSQQLSLPLDGCAMDGDIRKQLLARIKEIDVENQLTGVFSSEVLATRYERDQQLVSLIKNFRGNKCQICGFSFKTLAGEDYSECHHLEHLANGGLDISGNMLVLCANHHRQFHHGHVKLIHHSTHRIDISIDGLVHSCIL